MRRPIHSSHGGFFRHFSYWFSRQSFSCRPQVAPCGQSNGPDAEGTIRKPIPRVPRSPYLSLLARGDDDPVLAQLRASGRLCAIARLGALPAWKAFNQSIGSDGTVGIWHETYQVAAGQYEWIYANMPRFGLATAGGHEPATGHLRDARSRMQLRPWGSNANRGVSWSFPYDLLSVLSTGKRGYGRGGVPCCHRFPAAYGARYDGEVSLTILSSGGVVFAPSPRDPQNGLLWSSASRGSRNVLHPTEMPCAITCAVRAE